MNIRLSPRFHFKAAVLAFAFAAFPLFASAQVSGNDLVRIDAHLQLEQSKSETAQPKAPNMSQGMGRMPQGFGAETVTKGKTIMITISGKPKTPETRTGTWVAFAREGKGQPEVIDQGDFKIDLSAGPQKVESNKISITSTKQKGPSGFGSPMGSGYGGRPQMGGRRPEAEGKKFVGYVVTVKDGEKIVGQFADPQGLENRLK
jgi:hypothetical protein